MVYQLYHYDPSTGAAIVFAALFALTAAVHIVQMIRARTWYFIPFIIGSICMSPTWLGNLDFDQFVNLEFL
jgi:hypothetical protein